MGSVADKIKDLKDRQKQILQMGGKEAVAKHKKKGTMSRGRGGPRNILVVINDCSDNDICTGFEQQVFTHRV